MFKKRAIKVTLDKQDKKNPGEHQDTRLIEEKTEAILIKLGRFGAKVFAGVCIYVVLDTWRKVEVAKASQPK